MAVSVTCLSLGKTRSQSKGRKGLTLALHCAGTVRHGEEVRTAETAAHKESKVRKQMNATDSSFPSGSQPGHSAAQI